MNPFPLAGILLAWGRHFGNIELDVVADKEIQKAVPVVVEKRAPSAPPNALIVQPSLPRYIGKCSVAIVVEQDVMTPKAAEQVLPSVIVIIAHANTCLPTGAGQSRSLGNVGKGAVAVILK